MTLPSLSDSQKRNFSVTAQLLPPAKLEMPRSRNYIAPFLPQCLSQCLLSALAKQPQNNTTQINISPSIGQAASISLSANPCLFVPQSLPHSHLGLLQRGQVPPSLHLIHWTLMLSWAEQHDSAPPYQSSCNLASIYQSFSCQSNIKWFIQPPRQLKLLFATIDHGGEEAILLAFHPRITPPHYTWISFNQKKNQELS